MDRYSHWYGRTVLSLVLVSLIAACKSPAPTEPTVDPIKVAQDAKCAALAPKRENCSFAGDTMMVITPVSLPTYEKNDKHNPRVFSGTCEVLTEGAPSTEAKPCENVTLTATNPTVLGESPRSITINKKKFLIGGLPKSVYKVTAKSETHSTEVELREAPSGAILQIQIISPKPE